eukprot:115824-Amphidinium_carterae.1
MLRHRCRRAGVVAQEHKIYTSTRWKKGARRGDSHRHLRLQLNEGLVLRNNALGAIKQLILTRFSNLKAISFAVQ